MSNVLTVNSFGSEEDGGGEEGEEEEEEQEEECVGVAYCQGEPAETSHDMRALS